MTHPLAARSWTTLRVEEPEPRLLLVTLNRPDRANAMNTTLGEELIDLFGALEASPHSCQAVC